MPSETIWFDEPAYTEIQSLIAADGNDIENPSQAVRGLIYETTTNLAVAFETDPNDLSDVELAAEYRELNERRFSHTISEEGRERRSVVWGELLERTDVQQPECPECSGRNWGFTDHTVCVECDYAPEDADLLDDIQSSWDAVMAVGECDE